MAKTPLDFIIECIDDKKSFCFNSGAGSGKTYNLAKTIEYITDKYGRRLAESNQKVMVITYTNSATNEIVKRIGNSRICDISTIHTRLWDIINRFQTDLIKLHYQKIDNTIKEIEVELNDSVFTNDAQLINEIENNKEFIDDFYKYNSLNASEFRQKFSRFTTTNQISNVNIFKSFVKKTKMKLKLINARNGIESQKRGYRRVEYDPFDNSDKLHKMKFSHDTLIEYASLIIEQNKTLRKIISDKYPYALIDEYQDTSEKVVKSFGLLIPSVVVGFYGDNCQNIYDSGIGSRLSELLPELQIIKNEVNRRSTSEIVFLGNRIRNDETFNQKPFVRDTGSVEVYYSKDEDNSIVDAFISKVAKEFSGSNVDFLLLKNEQVADKNGFGGLYSTLCKTEYYKSNYKQMTTELLSDDETKLGIVPHNIFQIIQFVQSLTDGNGPISAYIPDSIYGHMNLKKLSEIVGRLKKTSKCVDFKGIINEFSVMTEEKGEYKNILEFNISECSFSSLGKYKSFLFEKLYGDIPEEKIPDAQQCIDDLLAISISEIINWYNYILRVSNKPINYHTFHGTKGLEFDNVGVVITNNFNRTKDYYHSFFGEWNKGSDDVDFTTKRNLLYVSMTRARKNLRVLYLDTKFDSIAERFNSVFGESKEFIAEK